MGGRGESYLRDGLRSFGDLRYPCYIIIIIMAEMAVVYSRGKGTQSEYVLEFFHSIVS